MTRSSLFLLLIFFSNFCHAENLKRILFLGDSLTEGYNLQVEQAYPHLIEEILKKEGRSVVCLNAGISGSTSASGLSRLKWHLKQKPDILVLALGANDGLRGLPVRDTKANLEAIIEEAKRNQIKILLAGMKIPKNMGKVYLAQFENMYPSLAKEYKIPLIPFILENVAGIDKLNLSDRIHPNSEGHKVVANNVLKYLRELL
jgi:acyl-CoA thioesterase-1